MQREQERKRERERERKRERWEKEQIETEKRKGEASEMRDYASALKLDTHRARDCSRERFMSTVHNLRRGRSMTPILVRNATPSVIRSR